MPKTEEDDVVVSQDGEEDDAALDPADENEDESASGTDDDAGEGEDGGDDDGGLEDAAARAALSDDVQEGEDGEPKKDPVKPFQKRINKLTREKSEAQREAEALKAENARLKAIAEGKADTGDAGESQSQDAADPEVYKEMGRKEAEQAQEIRQFNDQCNAVFEQGSAEHDDFEQAVGTLSALGAMDINVVKDVLVTDAPHEVLYQLAQDPDGIERILAMPSAKRIAEFTKIALKAGEKPKPNPSKAGKPIDPITTGSGNKDFDFADDDVDDDEWFERRQKEVDERYRRSIA